MTKYISIIAFIIIIALATIIFFMKKKINAQNEIIKKQELSIKGFEQYLTMLDLLEQENAKINKATLTKITEIRKLENIKDINDKLNLYFNGLQNNNNLQTRKTTKTNKADIATSKVYRKK